MINFYIDSANVTEIERILKFYPICGVTTNPTIIAHEKADYFKTLLRIRELIGRDRTLFVQVGGAEGQVRIDEAERIREKLGEMLSIKVPATEDGLKVTHELKNRGFSVTQTAVFSPGQAMLASAAGADYVAPYINRFTKFDGDGIGLVREISEIYSRHGITTRVLAASFGSSRQVVEASEAGASDMTLPPELFTALISHMMTDDAIKKFDDAWSSVYGEKQILDLLK